MQIKRLPVDHPLIQALPDGPGKPTALAMFTNSGYYQRPYPEWAFQTYARQSMAHMNAGKRNCDEVVAFFALTDDLRFTR